MPAPGPTSKLEAIASGNAAAARHGEPEYKRCSRCGAINDIYYGVSERAGAFVGSPAELCLPCFDRLARSGGIVGTWFFVTPPGSNP